MTTKEFLSLTVLLLALGQTWPASAQDKPSKADTKDKLVELLNGDKMPTSDQLWAVSADVDSALSDVINDKNAPGRTRLVAVKCLGHFQSKRARLLLRSLVTDPVWQKPFRIVAIVSMANSMGQEAFDDIRGYCLDSDADVRLSCVRAMGAMGGDRALHLVQDLQLRETDTSVQKAISETLQQLRALPWKETP